MLGFAKSELDVAADGWSAGSADDTPSALLSFARTDSAVADTSSSTSSDALRFIESMVVEVCYEDQRSFPFHAMKGNQANTPPHTLQCTRGMSGRECQTTAHQARSAAGD